jgi:DNA repair protein RecO (recombination protein O)
MFRTSTTEAVVLHSYGVGEYHKGVTLFSVDWGILRGIAHGAKKPKSRLRGATETFCHSTVYLYHEPVKNAYKITDMTVKDFFDNLRWDLSLYYTASVWAEVILKSYGGGGSCAEVFRLFIQSLRCLDRLGAPHHIYLSLQFLWRFLHIAGLGPDIEICSGCGKTIGGASNAFLSAHHDSFLCDGCVKGEGLSLDLGARKYLRHTSSLPIERAIRVQLEDSSRKILRMILYRLTEGLLETKLNSIRFTA